MCITDCVYKLNCLPNLCHTLGVTVYVCVLCLNYVILIVCLHLDTSTSAFDVIPHKTLLKKLYSYGIRGNVFD